MPRRKRRLIQDDENCMFKGWDGYERDDFKINIYKKIIIGYESERRLFESFPAIFKTTFCEALEEMHLKARIEEAVNEFPCFTTDLRRAAEFISEFSYDSDDESSEILHLEVIDNRASDWNSVNEVKSECISMYDENTSWCNDSDDSTGFDDRDDSPGECSSDLYSKVTEDILTNNDKKDKPAEVNTLLTKIPVVVLPKLNINNQNDKSIPLLEQSVVKCTEENNDYRIKSKRKNSHKNTTQTFKAPINYRLRNKENTQLILKNENSPVKEGIEMVKSNSSEAKIESEQSKNVTSPKTISNVSSLIPQLIIQMEKWKYFNDSFFDSMRKTTSDCQIISCLERDFSCDYCKRGFLQKQSLKRHILICSKRPDRMVVHNTVKEKIRDNQFDCKKCKKYFSTKFTLLRHFETKHNVLKTFKCLVCRWGFFNEQALQFHCIKRHGLGSKKPYNCAYCKENFLRRKELQYHCRRFHKASLYICSFCLKSFKSDAMCKNHEKSHGYKCDVCIFTTQSENEMDEHKLAHVLQVVAFNCEICSRRFNRRNDLKRHIKTHERERIPRK